MSASCVDSLESPHGSLPTVLAPTALDVESSLSWASARDNPVPHDDRIRALLAGPPSNLVFRAMAQSPREGPTPVAVLL